MLSVKKNVLQSVALLKAYGINQIVLSPGSRNAPLIQTFTQDSFFKCHTIVDERNAAFYALGIIQCLRQPVVICCTSGSALLNYAPAVSEAFYQQLPLIIISADRSPEWIGQMDGQTLPQPNAFRNLVKKSINLPEIKTETDEWYCNRILNEALITSTSNAQGPIHINIPIYEPLFDYSEKQLPSVRRIQYAEIEKNVLTESYIKRWNNLPKRIIVVGQHHHSDKLIKILEELVRKTNCIVLSENISNCVSPLFISNFDALLYAIKDEDKKAYSPDLVITIGGHIVSKRLKHFLRQYKPTNHWLINNSGEIADLFQSLTDVLETDAINFIEALLKESVNNNSDYFELWNTTSKRIDAPSSTTPFSDISVVGDFLKHLPNNTTLHLANSSSIRNVQLYPQNRTVEIFCNRGVNGIESALPTAIGFASVYDEPVYLIVGDLSFFYGVGALWNMEHIKNLRILLINNGGGGIFHLLPGLNQSESLENHVAAGHKTSAQKWALAAGLKYLSASNKNDLNNHLKEFTQETPLGCSILLEVFTDMETSKLAFQEYYHQLKTLI